MSSEAIQAGSTPREAPAVAATEREPLQLVGFVALVLLAPAAIIYLSFNAGGYFPSAPGFVAIVFALALILRTTLAAAPVRRLQPHARRAAGRARPLRRLAARLDALVARHRARAGQL